MSTPTNNNHVMYKAFSSLVIGTLADKYILKNDNMTQNLSFGVSTAIGITGGKFVGQMLPAIVPTMTGYYDGKTLLTRTSEIAIGAGSGYAINKYLLKNDFEPSKMGLKIGVVILTDVASEYFFF